MHLQTSMHINDDVKKRRFVKCEQETSAYVVPKTEEKTQNSTNYVHLPYLRN